jgi:DNA-binding NtrC family response regulator
VADAAVWLIESDSDLREVLLELYEQEGFGVLCARSLSDVWRTVLGGQMGVVVADATSLLVPDPHAAELAQYARLAQVVPVLLLMNYSHLPTGFADLAGGCAVLDAPFDDLDRLVSATRELTSRPLRPRSTCGSF